MFEISVEREFCAAHAIVIAGVREAVHGHNFRLTVTVAGETLDAEGLLIDFHALEKVVDEIIAPFHNADMNGIAPFDRAGGVGGGVNPTAEEIARHIAQRVSAGLAKVGGGAVPPRLAAVRLTEAAGCAVVYRP